MLQPPLLLHGHRQLTLFQLRLESLTPAENSQSFKGCGNFPITLSPPYLFPKITIFDEYHYSGETDSALIQINWLPTNGTIYHNNEYFND